MQIAKLLAKSIGPFFVISLSSTIYGISMVVISIDEISEYRGAIFVSHFYLFLAVSELKEHFGSAEGGRGCAVNGQPPIILRFTLLLAGHAVNHPFLHQRQPLDQLEALWVFTLQNILWP
jgi:hypothetical protein